MPDPVMITERLNVKNVLHFGVGQEGNRFLGVGWGVPEDGFVWTEGPFSTIHLSLPDECDYISFSIWGYAPKGRSAQNVLVFANGAMVGMAEVADKVVLRANLQHARVSGEVTLQFFVPNAQSPKMAEGISDDRRLGIALAALVVG